MHEGMQYDPIQGQGHEPLKVGNSAIFKGYLLPHLQWGWLMNTIPTAYRGRIFYFSPSFCVT